MPAITWGCQFYIFFAAGMLTYSRLQIDQDRSGNVSCVVGLVEEDVLAIAAFSRKVLEVAILANSMFLAKLLPKLASNYISLVSRRTLSAWSKSIYGDWVRARDILLLPHWPAWTVMISLDSKVKNAVVELRRVEYLPRHYYSIGRIRGAGVAGEVNKS